jgi:hypothetical protein
MSASALATEASEFRCARCGYGICVSGALPPCPMCEATTWDTWEPSDLRLAARRRRVPLHLAARPPC